MNPVGGTLFVTPLFASQAELAQSLTAGQMRLIDMKALFEVLESQGMSPDDLETSYIRWRCLESGQSIPSEQRTKTLAAQIHAIPEGKFIEAQKRLRRNFLGACAGKQSSPSAQIFPFPVFPKRKPQEAKPTDELIVLIKKMIEESEVDENAGEILRDVVIDYANLFTSTHLLLLLAAARVNYYSAWALWELVKERIDLFEESHIPLMIMAGKINEGAAWALAELAVQSNEFVEASSVGLSFVVQINPKSVKALEHLALKGKTKRAKVLAIRALTKIAVLSSDRVLAKNAAETLGKLKR